MYSLSDDSMRSLATVERMLGWVVMAEKDRLPFFEGGDDVIQMLVKARSILQDALMLEARVREGAWSHSAQA